MPQKSEPDVNGHVLIPRWFIWFLSGTIALVCTGGIPWAWSINTHVSEIRVELKAAARLRNSELDNIRARLDRHERVLDRLMQKE